MAVWSHSSAMLAALRRSGSRTSSTGDPIQITFGDLPAVRPRWSAQGDRIIYSRSGGGIWSVPPLGGEPRQIVKDGWNADVSPDGRRLVFERAGQIFIAGADGVGASQSAATSPTTDRPLRRQLADLLTGRQVHRGLPRRTGPATAITGSSLRTETSLAESRQTFRRAVHQPGLPTGRRSSWPRHDRAV